MKRKKMMYFSATAFLVLAAVFAWNTVSRAAYESAEYTVVTSDGKFEVREYPDLMLVATTTKLDAQGRDGSFMKLFRYISGANESDKKISMTTPVFMENDKADSAVQMGFVMPKDIAVQGVPAPTGPGVAVRKRAGGRFAVLRFSGQLDTKQAKDAEVKLRTWMASQELVADDSVESSGVETAGYDPPFTPGPLRRNEVLIRLK
ncbi:SOUL family heme-binding protein [Pirellulaceae bacterium SH449]